MSPGRVAVIGVGRSRPAFRRPESGFAELVHEAVTACLEDAGVSIAEVGNIVTCSNDFMDGRTISSMAVGDAAGAAAGEGKNISTVEGDGTLAAYYGMSRILSGGYASTLVVAHAKHSEGDYRLITNAWFDPIYERALGLDWMSAAALQARLVMDGRRLCVGDLDRVVERNRRHGAGNPEATLRAGVSPEELSGSPMMAPPLRAADISPLADGAAALLLGSEEFAGGRAKRPVWVAGAAFSADPRMTDRDLSGAPALRRAAESARRMAGLEKLPGEVDFVELDESFSYQQPLWLAELGLETLDDERINPSGGSACGRSEGVAGLDRIIAAARRLRGDAPVPLKNARLALAHGSGGPCAQSHCVWLLGN